VSARAVPNEGQRQRYGGRVSLAAAPKELPRSEHFHHRATGVGDTCDPRSTSGRQAPRRFAHDAGVNRRLLTAISPDKPEEGPSRCACRQAAHVGVSQASCLSRRVQGPSRSTREPPLPRTGGQRLVPAQAPVERANSPARLDASAVGAWGATARATPPEGSLLTIGAKTRCLPAPTRGGRATVRCSDKEQLSGSSVPFTAPPRTRRGNVAKTMSPSDQLPPPHGRRRGPDNTSPTRSH
jgi:hypothetical protein